MTYNELKKAVELARKKAHSFSAGSDEKLLARAVMRLHDEICYWRQREDVKVKPAAPGSTSFKGLVGDD